MDFIPHVVEAEYIKNYTIRLRFSDGSIKMVSLESYVERGGIFSRLKDKEFFKIFLLTLILCVGQTEPILLLKGYMR